MRECACLFFGVIKIIQLDRNFSKLAIAALEQEHNKFREKVPFAFLGVRYAFVILVVCALVLPFFRR